MITINFSFAVTIYTGLFLLIILVSWITSRQDRGRAIEMEELWQCPICTYLYFDYSSHDRVSVCPRCRSYNRREEVKI